MVAAEMPTSSAIDSTVVATYPSARNRMRAPWSVVSRSWRARSRRPLELYDRVGLTLLGAEGILNFILVNWNERWCILWPNRNSR